MAITPSGKDKLLRYARLYCDGYDLSGDALAFGSLDNAEEEVSLTGWSNTIEYYTISGRKTMGIGGLQAFMNPASGQAFDELKSSPVSKNISIVFGGGGEPAIGDPCYVFPALSLGDAIAIDNHRMVINIDNVRVDSDNFDDLANFPLGWMLQDIAQQNATFNSNSVDMGADQAGTVIGCQAFIHIFEASGTTWTFKIQDSINDSAWADVLTFTADGSTIISERASTGNQIDRYVRFQGTAAGAGTTTVVVTFAPRVRV